MQLADIQGGKVIIHPNLKKKRNMPKLYLSDNYNSVLVNDDGTFATVPYTVSLKTYILKDDADIYTKDGRHFKGKKGDGVAVVAEYVPKSKKSRYFFFKLDAESLKEYNEFLKEKHSEDDLTTVELHEIS